MDPRSLQLLRSMYDDLLPHFGSRLFNVGCDETFDVGTGRSKSVCERKGVHRVYLDFLLQIHELVRERGHTMMFWGDNGHRQYELMSYLGYAYGAGVSWALDANRAIDLPAALSLQAFDDVTGTMGQLAYDLGYVYRAYERWTSERLHNASFLVRILYEPVEPLESRGVSWQGIDPQLFGEAREEIDRAMAMLPQAATRRDDAVLVRREFESAARLLRHACALGVLRVNLASLAVGEKSEPLAERAGELAEDMRGILAEHGALWLARNRIGGLEEGSGNHFRGMIAGYRHL